MMYGMKYEISLDEVWKVAMDKLWRMEWTMDDHGQIMVDVVCRGVWMIYG